MTESSDNKASFSGWKVQTGPLSGAPAKLCTRCQSLFDNWEAWLKPGTSIPHHVHPAEFRSAGLNHCPICYQFLRSKRRVYYSSARDVDVSTIGTWKLREVRVYRHQYQPVTTADHDFRFSLSFEIPKLGCENDANTGSAYSRTLPIVEGGYRVVLYPTRKQSNEPPIDELGARSTKSSLTLAKRWLYECSSHHETCKIHSPRHAPTRLVSTAIGQCRVHLRNEFKTSVEYATLSHCWGKIKHLTLNKSNLHQLQIQIPDEALSHTIQDAITIARDLGFAYIWIDTLCIIQDDPEDWRREAAVMSSVYGSSGLNIAATGARDGRHGCFFPRPAHWKCQMKFFENGGSLSYSAVPEAIYSSCLSNMPLMERGWVLQERLLAARTLHFTTTEVFWECNHHTVCESFPEELPELFTMDPDFLNKQRLVDSMWPWIVTTYSRCKLTYAEDKLVAISGLAREIQQQTNDHYLAGMWRRDMEAQLCWYTESPGPRRKRVTYIAPSWSWAALDSPISNYFRNFPNSSVLAGVMDAKIGHTGPDPLGAIDNAIIQICCYGLHSMQFDTSTGLLLTYGNEDPIGGLVHPDNVPDEGEEQLQDVFLLPIFENHGNTSTITGLVLQRVGQAKGVYKRVGLFNAPTNGNLVESLGNIVNDGEVNFSETYYTEVLRDESGTAITFAIDVI